MSLTRHGAASLATVLALGLTLALPQIGAAGADREGAVPPFVPPPDSAIPDDDLGKVIRLGEHIFHDTRNQAPAFVGNDLRCTNCHLDRGRLGHSAPLWAAYVTYPAYRAKNRHVNTFAERLQGCFRYSMNGKAPPLGDPVLVALESYAAFLAHGAPVGVKLPGQGYPKLTKPKGLDIPHGREVYAAKCALCHGENGAGQASSDGTLVFPPLWGGRSYNWGAGMSSVVNAAGFIKANMPLGQGNSLTDAEAWDVAAYIDSRERPQDPRFTGDLAATRAAHHDSPYDFYGQTVDGVTLGAQSSPAGTVAR
ncbi:MAG: cytochrome C [Cupriavidus sp.]|uniref:Thiosulfate dehydrogenase n=1 Tax=Methylobacterium brachiatum TaxID=269660 RepID=A0AAJ1WXN1_9HYPH|nr:MULTISPECIES: c-type cytochrome [Methylobacterium]EIZ84840.1 cytochrome c, class I [Methylobacterium sp. GXF4]MBU69282.1 cytochrome C [Cupriavidus sp.]MCB4804573.1 c-type cytochrome [Methylobacterium brachiatum]MDQ0545607.1 thiosulfate dehydrogenase [Methylobacterium brachiatum]